MSIVTRTGDDGQTGWLGPGRVPKDDPRIEAFGTVDELNAALGVAAVGADPRLMELIRQVQSDLFTIGSALADPDPGGRFFGALGAEAVDRLEASIAEVEGSLAPLTSFILPGGTARAAQFHVARTICRRAERRVVGLARRPGEQVDGRLIVYLNRLGDLLFLLARAENALAGEADVPWRGL